MHLVVNFVTNIRLRIINYNFRSMLGRSTFISSVLLMSLLQPKFANAQENVSYDDMLRVIRTRACPVPAFDIALPTTEKCKSLNVPTNEGHKKWNLCVDEVNQQVKLVNQYNAIVRNCRLSTTNNANGRPHNPEENLARPKLDGANGSSVADISPLPSLSDQLKSRLNNATQDAAGAKQNRAGQEIQERIDYAAKLKEAQGRNAIAEAERAAVQQRLQAALRQQEENKAAVQRQIDAERKADFDYSVCYRVETSKSDGIHNAQVLCITDTKETYGCESVASINGVDYFHCNFKSNIFD